MSLEKIVEKVIEDARAEADRITQESRKKAEEIKETARKEASKLREALVDEAKRKANLEASRLVTQARLEKRIQLLSWKKELIDEIMEKALKQANIDEDVLKKKIVLKDGEQEESYDRDRLIEELRPKLENFILEVLKI